MFKELKILKLSLFAIFLAIIIWKVSESNKISVFFTTDLSHYVGSEIEVFQAGNFDSEDDVFIVSDLEGEIVYKDVFEYVDNLQKNKAGNEFSTANKKLVQLPDRSKSGVYLMNGLYSLILRSEKESDITIVYPYANNLIYQDEGYGTILSNELADFNLNAPVLVDDYTIGLKELFKFCSNNFSVNFITDIELENKSIYAASKLLVIYGQASFYSLEMKNNVIEFLNNGGNILLMSSSFSANAIWLDNNGVRFSESLSSDNFVINSWLRLNSDIREDIGLSYKSGGKAKSVIGQSYKILNSNHKIFQGVDGVEIPLSANHYTGAYCKWSEETSRYILKNDFYKSEILAFNECKNGNLNENIGGVYLIQPDSTSGVLLSLGTEDWCLDKNQSKKEVFTISKNAISFLLK
jgi:hypothetical protein